MNHLIFIENMQESKTPHSKGGNSPDAIMLHILLNTKMQSLNWKLGQIFKLASTGQFKFDGV
jgi:hypothetical protein